MPGQRARYPTLYFRKTVNIVNPAAYLNFQVRANFDDAIVVWVNGQEAFRNNISANPAYATLSSTSIAGDGATIFTGNVPTSLFNSGNNIIAVEIHQTTATSGDLYFDMELIGVNDVAVTRGPYLQMGGQTGITIRWRTDVPTNSRVTFGNSLGLYPNTVDDAAATTEHIVNLSGLSPDTKYFYTIGTSGAVLQSGAPNYFITTPPATANRKMRIAAFGDCGFSSANQNFTKQAYMNFLAARGITEIDGLILMGDNVYETGTDAEWQTNFFDPYKDVFLKNWKMYPSPGNHDYGNTNTIPETINRNNNYYQNFTLPTAGQLGGVASGTEAYYSFDIGDIHFLSLDSYGREAATSNSKMYDTLGAQALWVKADLAANTKKWVVAYWHHAPYTKIGLNSDPAGELRDVRENFIRILERNGVDLVICGHSHGYERSYLLKNYYKATAADPALLDADFRKTYIRQIAQVHCTMVLHPIAVLIHTIWASIIMERFIPFRGSSGKNDQTAQTGYPHDAMFFSQLNKGGAFYFEVDSNRLDAKYIWQNGNTTPLVGDSFTIFKGVKKFTTYTTPLNGTLNITTSWKGLYNWFAAGTTSPNLSTNRTFSVPTNVAGTFRYVVKDFSTNTCLKDSFEVVVTNVVPITLSSFTANLIYDKVQLRWTTATEQNNKYFTIEKSDDGANFKFLARVNSVGNSTSTNNYSAMDITPFNGINYYRLSQTNIDDKITYHQTKTVLYNGKKNLHINIANAFNGVKVSITSNGSNTATLRIIDAMGRQVLQNNLLLNTTTVIKDYQLKKGIYYIQLVDALNEKVSKKVIIL
ncbi:MAG: metallophosphoesterase [Chitinophagaceae bacterium]|nr:metallophosphoesterase [Chitinophagaceae bacterium]